jgi:DNA repair exonuclease SbcCD ATPase subunit
MNNLSDSQILEALEDLQEIINHGILQGNELVQRGNELLQDAWSHEDFRNLKEEISQARQELQIARMTLENWEEQSMQVLEKLEAACLTASQEYTGLSQLSSQSEELYLSLKEEEEERKKFQANLFKLIQKYQQLIQKYQQNKTDLDKTYQQSKTDLDRVVEKAYRAVQKIQDSEHIISELDTKYNDLLKIKTDLEGIISRIDGYQSINDLVNSIREATKRLQEEQIQARKVIADFELMKYKVNNLVQAQLAPWWWPANWWWKKKSSLNHPGKRLS